jgi:enamine deaminase RidA (YjgF/YER057c/UK114 family)
MFNHKAIGPQQISDPIPNRFRYPPPRFLPLAYAQYDDNTFLAGQIGLVPVAMALPAPKSVTLESVLSLQHIFRVARAVNVDPLQGIEGAVAYITEQGNVNVVMETWRRSFEGRPPPLAIVLVNGLPRGAALEWHVIRCRKTSDEEATGEVRMVFDCDDAVSGAFAELRGEHGVLYVRFGSLLPDKLRSDSVAVQEIPSNAVYSVGEQISRHTSCTIIITG